MNLFRRHRNPEEPAEIGVHPAPAAETHKPIQVLPISLSAEEKSLLEKPVDPRVERIPREMYADKEAAERALNSQRFPALPSVDIDEHHVIQDEDGSWRIVPNLPPQSETQLFDAL